MTFDWIIKKFHKCPEPEIIKIPVNNNVWPAHFVALDRSLLKEIRGMELSEKKDHIAEISKIHEVKAFHREIESMVDQQVYFLAERALNGNQLSFGRGTINGMRLVKERFKDLHNEHLAEKKPQDDYNPYEIFQKE